jgi:hypothetical protein
MKNLWTLNKFSSQGNKFLIPLKTLKIIIYYHRTAVAVIARLPPLITKQTRGNANMMLRVPSRPFTM